MFLTRVANMRQLRHWVSPIVLEHINLTGDYA
jgi:hypothetical protein